MDVDELSDFVMWLASHSYISEDLAAVVVEEYEDSLEVAD